MNNPVTHFRAGRKLRDYWVQILLFIDEEIKAQNRAGCTHLHMEERAVSSVVGARCLEPVTLKCILEEHANPSILQSLLGGFKI